MINNLTYTFTIVVDSSFLQLYIWLCSFVAFTKFKIMSVHIEEIKEFNEYNYSDGRNIYCA